MAIKTDTPQVVALKKAVEKRFGRAVETRADFAMVVADIELVTKEHVAESTLRRLWGRLRGYSTVFKRTLDVLSCYAGYSHWDSFCRSLANSENRESELIMNGHTIKAEELSPGDRIRIGWLPDRECVVEFIGGTRFKAIQTQNSTLQEGDTFECSVMLRDYPLFVDNLVHGGELCQRYSIGINSGLTILERL